MPGLAGTSREDLLALITALPAQLNVFTAKAAEQDTKITELGRWLEQKSNCSTTDHTTGTFTGRQPRRP